MRPFVEDLAQVAPTCVACYPNAGLPNAFGAHDEQPDDTSRFLGEFARAGLVNIVGGCCGTTPEHIRAIAPRSTACRRAACPSGARSAGLRRPRAARDPPDTNFVMVGERTNVTGSARFRRLIKDGN